MTDEIVLTLPRRRDLYDVAHLVVGGLAARLDLTIEHLEDLQVALDGLLPREGKGDITVRMKHEDGAVTVQVGPFASDELERELGRGDEESVGLARVLSTVADRYDVEQRDGGAWVVLRKLLGEPA